MFGKSNKMLVEAGLSIAIAFVLHLITLFQMPQGGLSQLPTWPLSCSLPTDGEARPAWL